MAGPPPRQLLLLVSLFYLPMVASAAFVKPPGDFRVQAWPLAAFGLAIAVAAGLAVVTASRIASRRTQWGKALRGEFREVLGRLGSAEILALSLLSAFGEEILFRGVLHPRLGLWVTAGLFGLVHFPIRPALVPWTLFALVLGVGLGAMTDVFATLWPPILLHFIINYFNLHDLMAPGEPLPPEME